MKMVVSFALVVLALAGSRCAPLTGFAERSFAATEPAPERLVVATSFLDVEIVATPGPTVGIEGRVELRTSGGNEVAEREIERVALRSERDGGTLTVRTGPLDSTWVYEGRRQGQGRLRIDLPPSIPIEIRTASGDVTLHGDFADAPLIVRTASGDLSIDRLAGPATVRSASGDVRIALVALTAGQRIAIDTASGDVTLTLAPGLEPRGGASTASGDLSISVPVALERRKAIFTGAADAGELEMSTASGDIRVRRSS